MTQIPLDEFDKIKKVFLGRLDRWIDRQIRQTDAWIDIKIDWIDGWVDRQIRLDLIDR